MRKLFCSIIVGLLFFTAAVEVQAASVCIYPEAEGYTIKKELQVALDGGEKKSIGPGMWAMFDDVDQAKLHSLQIEDGQTTHDITLDFHSFGSPRSLCLVRAKAVAEWSFVPCKCPPVVWDSFAPEASGGGSKSADKSYND